MLAKQYQGIVLFLGDSLREYSVELGYDANETFDVNDVITDGESNFVINHFKLDAELGMTAECQFIDEEFA